MKAAELIDRTDERLHRSDSPVDTIRLFLDRIRSGELGSLPVIVGLVLICGVFEGLNSVFLSSGNLVNLLYDSSTIGVISLGIVGILMVGEIDLSVGSVSGFSSALVGVLWVNMGWPVWAAIAAAIACGAVIGLVYAFLFNRFSMPSFVSTLSGLLAILGLQLYILGDTGSINLPYGSRLVTFGQSAFVPPPIAYAAAVLAGLALFATELRTARRRRGADLSSRSVRSIAGRALLLGAVLAALVFYLDRDAGVPWMLCLFIALVLLLNYTLTRTRWGRAMTAVGGNREAARRAGINVARAYTSAFVMCSVLASIGGILASARLASASQQAGTGDVNLDAIAAAVIGGTSLFGGRGSAYSALLGIVVIQAISNGLTLLDLSSSLRYMITGSVLAIAVIVDSLTRRSRLSHGRA
ncbi:xylose ABC transporter permease [Ameyamaea chiangmaiensis NBRC 103196]|uniref:Xylose transport system permease protein XylH n=1 Tax=Ameyamaea chiangmaiensis TaxID=442969 RepID=A0A850P7N7_9PROT|nr:sugar ABC transporter permease [Ameyamaea chiangmaiensis]MBS4074133.1 hypothetical protein [Ameyamaea chiangmaiensis]NVN39944.1 sugar ABC transporter permease [Ameyamaea chiangmaiensis]GBQ70991.1 xylose ABC transporter permease [Ameyamaea chiangmaiensis NBRC 103196]